MSLHATLTDLPPWLATAVALLGAIVVGLIVHRVVFALAARLSRRTALPFDELLLHHSRRPARVLVPLLFVSAVWGYVPLGAELLRVGQRALGMTMIASVAWLVIAVLAALVDWTDLRFRADVADNLAARRIQTQAVVLKRIANVVIILIAAALILMQIPGVENVGASLLASAGLAGIVIGMAARPTVSNLLAGIQLALTQPIRLDDVVIVEGEWGRIEEIRNTYVVVRIWDLRRLVVPLTYFIEKPFQNWTRVTADLLGTVYLSVDYTTPVEAVRAELKRILDASGMWDGKVWNLQVTDASDRTVQLRALMSAPDSGTAWNLRCHVREQLLTFLQTHYPQSLPRTRAQIEGAPERASAAASVQ